MKVKWIFWLIRILIYGIIITILILLYKNNHVNCSPCPAGEYCPPCPDHQSSILLIGKIFGIAVLAIELLFVLRGTMKRKREN